MSSTINSKNFSIDLIVWTGSELCYFKSVPHQNTFQTSALYETIDSETTNTNDGKIYHKFTVCVKDLNNQIIGKAYAKSIKDAQQRAAQYALQYYGIFNRY